MDDPLIEDILKRLTALEQKSDEEKTRRINQADVLPDAIKTRHIGEGIRFIQTGLAADRPDTPQEPPASCMIYFSYDTNTLSVWNVSTNAWKDEVLT